MGYPVLITHGSRGATKLQGPNIGCIGTQGALPKRVLEFLSFEIFIRRAPGGLSIVSRPEMSAVTYARPDNDQPFAAPPPITHN